jgi:TonB family protein
MKSMLVVLLLLTLVPIAAVPQQVPRDTPPASIENARRERDLRATIAAGTATKEVYADLAALLNRQGRFEDLIEVLRGAAALEPSSAEPQHRIAVLFWDQVRGDATLDAAHKLSYIRQGLEAEDRALAVQPDYTEAMTYKNILLRMQANMSTDPMEQMRLTDEADALRNRVIDMQRGRQAQNAPQATEPADAAPFAGFPEPFDQAIARLQPVRVGGNIKVPTKVKDVKPVYPPIAQSARVQGVIILEVLIDEGGSVANARVLRSIPLLDAAALGAVSQWQFTPTELDGRRVAVIVTVTVNFTLVE